MKKEYMSPKAQLIELKMSENIAGSKEDAEITGSWKFTVSSAGSCFEYVNIGVPSGYDGRGIASAAELKDAGFSPTWYIMTLSGMYSDSFTTIWAACGA